MFTRVSTGQVKSDKLDEFVKIYEESIIPAAKAQAGFCGDWLLTNRETCKGIAISFWDTQEDAIANEESGYYQEQLDKIKHLMTALPIREGYEVSITPLTPLCILHT